MNSQKKTALVWFRRDLRLQDNPALWHACRQADYVIPVFIEAPEEEGSWKPGAASHWWLHHSLASLQKQLAEKKSKLILGRGKSLGELQRIARESNASSVYWNRCYEPLVSERDAAIKKALREAGIETHSFNGSLLFDPWTVRNQQDKPYKVYTPFWNKMTSGEPLPEAPLEPPADFKAVPKWPKSLELKAFDLEPKVAWYQGMQKHWQPGCAGAAAKLKAFSGEKVLAYEAQRNIPSLAGTSSLSPHLHFGEIGPREVWAKIKKSQKTVPYLRQIVWREFASHLLHHFPHTPEKPLDEKFEKFPWKKNSKLLKAWQKGQTGYPIVDAGMRELWQTGWMHNRVRMIAASFLVKDLMIPWQDGAKWFWDTLVDADLANNTMGWQWVAGCGADAAPFFRIFNPVTQGEKFDPDGNYVRQWVPEIKGLPKKFIHQPWQAPAEVLEQAGIKLGKNYPAPIVDHGLARREALFAYERLKR